jgi:alkylhydroperoxidase family enzyme
MTTAMDDRFADRRRALEDAVLRGPGHTDPDLRQRVAERRDLPRELAALADKIERHAYQITDQDLAALKARYSEDELFEIVVAASLGSALTRLRAGLRALEET